MKKLFWVAVIMAFLSAGTSYAIPSLQLDIANGTYDLSTETIISSGSSFDLYAYLLVNDQNNLLTDKYYLSAAVTPKVGPLGSDLGSISINGSNINVTGDMIYGTPPVETLASTINASTDPKDLAGHGIFETYFKELEFSFSAANQISPYNTQDRAINGDPIPTSGNGMYYVMFSIDTANLASDYFIHFDLYNSSVSRKSATDLDILKGQFAPFSHDAQSNGHKVPEPGTLVLLGMGLFGIGLFGRRK